MVERESEWPTPPCFRLKLLVRIMWQVFGTLYLCLKYYICEYLAQSLKGFLHWKSKNELENKKREKVKHHVGKNIALLKNIPEVAYEKNKLCD